MQVSEQSIFIRGGSIIPEVARASLSESIDSARRSRSFDVLNVGDLSLLSKVIEKKLPSKAALMSGNGKATFHISCKVTSYFQSE